MFISADLLLLRYKSFYSIEKEGFLGLRFPINTENVKFKINKSIYADI